MNTYKIATIPGDGIGPEVVQEGLKVLDAVSKKYNFNCDITPFDLGGQRYLDTGEVLPDSVMEELKKFDEIVSFEDVKLIVDSKAVMFLVGTGVCFFLIFYRVGL